MDEIKSAMNLVVLPAGKYYVGDPCYSIPDEDWMEWLEKSEYTVNDRNWVLAADLGGGRIAAAASTKYGDGCYSSSDSSKTFGVDAGLIGLVSCSWNEGLEEDDSIRYVITFEHPVLVGYDDGTITFRPTVSSDPSLSVYTEDAEDDFCYVCGASCGPYDDEVCWSCQEDEMSDLPECDNCGAESYTYDNNLCENCMEELEEEEEEN